MKKSKRLRLLALLLAVCSVVAIVSGCNKETPTTGDPSDQQGTSTAPEPSTTIAPESTDTTEPKEEQKYYLSGTWLMNETLEPLVELTGKTQKEELEPSEWHIFFIGGVQCSSFTWTFSHLDYEDGYTSKTLEWKASGKRKIVYSEGRAFSDFTGWGDEADRTIVWGRSTAGRKTEVSEQFYLWFTKNAVKISDNLYPELQDKNT